MKRRKKERKKERLGNDQKDKEGMESKREYGRTEGDKIQRGEGEAEVSVLTCTDPKSTAAS